MNFVLTLCKLYVNFEFQNSKTRPNYKKKNSLGSRSRASPPRYLDFTTRKSL